MLFVCSAFSPAMIPVGLADRTRLADLSQDDVEIILARVPFTSAVGHQTTADALTQVLGRPVANNRVNVQLNIGDVAIVALPSWPGGRPPEGATVLPEGTTWRWFQVSVV